MNEEIYVWDIVPFGLDRPNPRYAEFKQLIRERSFSSQIIVERVGDEYRIVIGKLSVMAARAVGIYRISVWVSRNPCSEIALD